MTIKLILADDHRIMQEGLKAILEKDPDIQVVGVADDGRTAVDLVGRLSPDVVVMDIGMSEMNGIEATRKIVSDHPQVKVIALSAYPDRGYVLGMLDAGASGYVLKAAVGGELLRAIRSVMEGQHYLSGEITGVVIKGAVDRTRLLAGSVYSVLADREREVLQLLAEGKSVKETAACLGTASRTVEAHRRNIMKKLGLHSIAELTKYAIREGLTRLDT